MTQPQHPTPEPVKGGIDIEKEAIELWDRLRISMAPADYSSRIIVLEQYISSLCDRVRQEERERVLDEAEGILKCSDCNGDGHLVVADSNGDPQMEHCQRCYDTGVDAETNALVKVRSLRTKPVPLKENDPR